MTFALTVTRTGSLIAISAVAFIGGMALPLAVIAEPGPSTLAYGILMVSFPVWAVGAAAGAMAGWLEGRADSPETRQRRLGWALAGVNVGAIAASVLWNPPGVS